MEATLTAGLPPGEPPLVEVLDYLEVPRVSHDRTMGSAVCSPMVDIWDITPKPQAPDTLELSRFPKARPHSSQSATGSPSQPPILDPEIHGEDVSMTVFSPEGSSGTLQLPA